MDKPPEWVQMCSGCGLDATLQCALRFPWYWVYAIQFGDSVADTFQLGSHEATFFQDGGGQNGSGARRSKFNKTFSCLNIHNK